MKQENKNKYLLPSFTILMFFIVVALVGISLISQLSVKLSPSAVLPRLTVEYRMPNASSAA